MHSPLKQLLFAVRGCFYLMDQILFKKTGSQFNSRLVMFGKTNRQQSFIHQQLWKIDPDIQLVLIRLGGGYSSVVKSAGTSFIHLCSVAHFLKSSHLALMGT